MIQVATAFVLVALLMGGMLATLPTTDELVVAVFALFVPFSFVGGILGVVHALLASPVEWRHLMRGLIALGLMAMAWAHFSFLGMIRRSAEVAGHADAVRIESHTWRIVAYTLLVLSGLFVLRWGTRHPIMCRWAKFKGITLVAELPWIMIGLGWTAFVIAEGEHLNRALVWIYRLVT